MLIDTERNEQKSKPGDEAPQWKDVIIVIIVAVLLISFSWVAWVKFKWFH